MRSDRDATGRRPKQPVGPRRRAQRGASLIEALVAFLVLSLSMLSMARLQNQLRLHADVARQRSEAVQLAQDDIEALRAFGSLTPRAGVLSFDAIASSARSVASLNGQALNTRYDLRRAVVVSDTPRLATASVSVEWRDRAGNAQRVMLETMIAGHDPALSAVLSLRGNGQPLIETVAARTP